jgi:hypothetical protein
VLNEICKDFISDCFTMTEYYVLTNCIRNKPVFPIRIFHLCVCEEVKQTTFQILERLYKKRKQTFPELNDNSFDIKSLFVETGLNSFPFV